MPVSVTNIGHATNNAVVASFTLTVTNGAPKGATLIVTALEVSATLGSVTDSGGNSYTNTGTLSMGSTARMAVFRSVITTAIAAGGTITYTKGGSSNQCFLSAGYIQDIGAYDSAAFASLAFTTSTTPSLASGTPSAAGDLFVAVYGLVTTGAGTITNDSNWTSPPFDLFNSTASLPGSAGGFRTNASATTVTYAPTTTASTASGIIIIAFGAGITQNADFSKPVRLPGIPPPIYQRSLALTAPAGLPAGLNPDFSKPSPFRPAQVLAGLPVSLALLSSVVVTTPQPRAPVLGPEKQPPNAPQILMGSPTALLAPPAQNPIIPLDFSKPFFPRVTVDATQPTNINLFTNPIPFGPFDYQISHDVISSPPQPQPYNPNIFTNPIPFGPYDWNKTVRVPGLPPQAAPYNLNVYTPPAPVPFAQYDWAPAHTIRSLPGLSDQAIWALVEPFIPNDLSKSEFPYYPPPQPQPYNPNVYQPPTAPAPFLNVDYSKPFFPPNVPGQIFGAIVDVTFPFNQYDWSKTTFLPPRAPDQIYPNIALVVGPPPPMPFAQYDWPLTHTIRSLPGLSDQAIWSLQSPFGPYDWNTVHQFPPRAPDQIYPDLVLIQAPPVQAPIIPIDWSKPFFPQVRWDQTRPTNINILTNPIPFGPYDWSAKPKFVPSAPPQPIERNPLIFSEVPTIPVDYSKPLAVRSSPPQAQQYNVLLFSSPFIPVDFSAPKFGPAFQPPAQPYNVALLAPPTAAPFLNIDWSKPFAIRLQQPQPQPNLTIKLPPPPAAPIIPFDWSKPYAIRPVVPQSQPNLTLYLPPPPVINIPALCYSRDIPVAAFKPDDVATAASKAKDFGGFVFKASDSPSGQNWSGAGFMAIYEIDTTLELQGIFTNALTGQYADPTAITLYILDPAGVQTTQIWPGGAIVRDNTGHFHFIMTPAKSGNWTYKWQGTGAANATSPDTIFTVNASALIPG